MLLLWPFSIEYLTLLESDKITFYNAYNKYFYQINGVDNVTQISKMYRNYLILADGQLYIFGSEFSYYLNECLGKIDIEGYVIYISDEYTWSRNIMAVSQVDDIYKIYKINIENFACREVFTSHSIPYTQYKNLYFFPNNTVSKYKKREFVNTISYDEFINNEQSNIINNNEFTLTTNFRTNYAVTVDNNNNIRIYKDKETFTKFDSKLYPWHNKNFFMNFFCDDISIICDGELYKFIVNKKCDNATYDKIELPGKIIHPILPTVKRAQ